MTVATGHEKHYLQVELEQRLAADPEIFSFLCRGSLDGIWYWDLEHPRHGWMSPEFWHLVGLDPATKAHDPLEWQGLIFPEDRATVFENFERHCADPDHPYDQLVRYRHADGSTVWIRCRGIAIRDDTGRPIRLLGAHNDMTAVKQAEAQAIKKLDQRLVRQVRRAEQANGDLERFTHMAAHDLREPCRRQVMLADLILDEHATEITPTLRAQIEQLAAQATNMLMMITGFRSLAGMAGPVVERSAVDLGRLAQRLVAELLPPDAEVHVDLPGDVHGYEPLLEILFRNLIDNAVTHGTQPPQLDLHTEQADGETIYVVENPTAGGCRGGDKLFTPFVRGSGPSPASSGLGLSICQRIIQRHSGTISLADSTDSFRVQFTLGPEP